MQRYSKKRERILQCLLNTKEHPSAERIYSQLKGEIPSLSLATVYRNLKNLKEEGLVRSVGIVDGEERFDADTSPHTHMICIKCGRVIDAEHIILPESFCRSVENIGFSVIRAELTVSGICAQCEAKNDNVMSERTKAGK